MSQQNKIYFFSILFLLSFNFYFISINAGILQENISGKFNSFQVFIFQINNLSSSLIPTFIFTFFYITIKLCLEIFNIDSQNISLSNIIATALLPVLIFSFVYLVLIFSLNQSNLSLENHEIKDIILISNFTFSDFKNIGYMFWIIFYLILTIELKFNYNTSFLRAVIISLLPSLIVIVFNDLLLK